ncbi:hypothetical protein NDA14_002204 [Ustilago hordei]|uniref:Uncharacterized protein n=1 Tax=Ustilago hordei TaxID=120017 RepID=I2FZW5_USTHO|nr:uncharacterized protein UHO2_03751 [Ustilago hordei]KAJ1044011.1 hypothetical protein NDA10_000673 [Ustilago hordei]KAJ1578851.1 hypothetical protein NDA15_000790 [Ustilago hordei]KAJ1580597.1 hypothetical protein NDA12_002545 [Ustilago hordei]KAJ1597257.1 hypothetical protein NDA14_002204 [Ustilago hordei]UTT92147.1 hypothetical protein NDA17_000654 [Ustilago hordei]
MSGDKLIASTQKQKRPFIQLPLSLAQLVDDRFDEDQHDQAVDLLEQLTTERIKPSKSLIQKLVALSLCSLDPGQLTSTSRWTLDHQLHDIAARLLTHSKRNKSDRDVIKAASAASDRPSQTAVLKATSLLLLQRCRHSSSLDVSGHDNCMLARHVLEAFPSRRKPLETPMVESSKSPRRANTSLPHSDQGHDDGSFEQSSIERWIRTNLHRAEDIWDLLCNHRFSSPVESEEVSPDQVAEFWMNDAERRRYQRQLQTATSSQQRLEDQLRQLQRRRSDHASPSDSDGEDTSADDDLPDLRIPGRSKKRPLQPKTQRQKKPSPAKPLKRARSSKPAPLDSQGREASNRQICMTEGAWRTLAVLLVLWRDSSLLTTSANGNMNDDKADAPPLLWQFPGSHAAQSTTRLKSKAAANSDGTDDIDRALDVAFSFPRVLPAYALSSSETKAASDLFDTATSNETRGDARRISSVSQAELLHRQRLTHQKEERSMAVRAETAAQLLLSVYDLVERRYINPVAFVEGITDRIKLLRANALHYLMLPLLDCQPFVVAKVLSSYLREAARTHPDHQKTPSRFQFQVRRNDEDTVDFHAALAYAVPLEEKTNARLANARGTDRDANSVSDFLSLNRLELENSAECSFPLTMPTRSESRKRTFVQRQRQTAVKSESSLHKLGKTSSNADSKNVDAAVLTEEMKKGGLIAFAFVRTLQMEARDRINQVKFLVARAMLMLHASDATAFTQQKDEKKNESGRSTEQQEPAFKAFLSELSEALDQDAVEFKNCLSAMKSHVSRDNAVRHQLATSSQGTPFGTKSDLPALPSFEAMVKRCEGCCVAAQNLALSTRLMKESVP